MNRQRTIVLLLAVFCVLLVLNLIKGEPEAQAEPQAETGGPGACCLPDGSCVETTAGGCATVNGTYHGDGTDCVSFDCTPVRVVSVTMDRDPLVSAGSYRIIRAWSDGDVDVTWVRFISPSNLCNIEETCGPISIIPPPCPADINNDLSVNVLDLVELLSVFGVTCPS